MNSSTQSSHKLEQVAIKYMVQTSYNADTRETDRALKEIITSIREFGILEPLIVVARPDNYYEIVDGNRRFLCAQKLGIYVVPAIVHRPAEGQSYEELRDLLWTAHNKTSRPVSPRERVTTGMKGGPVYNSVTDRTVDTLKSWFTDAERQEILEKHKSISPMVVNSAKRIVFAQLGENADLSTGEAKKLGRTVFRWILGPKIQYDVKAYFKGFKHHPAEYPIINIVRAAERGLPGVPKVTPGVVTPRKKSGFTY